MTTLVKCKVCGASMARGLPAATLACCNGALHWCGCNPRPFPDIAAFVSKFKRLHAVVCKGKALN